MFKAQRGLTKEDVIILDSYWNEETVTLLRQNGRDDELICPVCKQPVLVKAGQKKRWHFAHKDLTNCPLKNESPNVLQARMLLYSWLKSKFGEKVTVEQYFPESNLPRPIDCYVELSNEHKIGYWILEKGIRDRWAIQHSLSELGISNVWVPLANLLREDNHDQETIHLTSTERDIAYISEYNSLYSGNGRSLSYLDVENNNILTLRGLHCIHSPQKYHFNFKLVTILDQVLLSQQTGEFVHPGEHERLEKLKKEIEKQKRLRAIEEQRRRSEENKRQQKLTEKQDRTFSRSITQTWNVKHPFTETSSHLLKPPKGKKIESESCNYLEKPFPCIVCAKMTTNWTTLDLNNNTCTCSNECLADSQKGVK